MGRGELKSPPPDLAGRRIAIAQYGSSFFRTHDIGLNPVFYGTKKANRFDAPDSSSGVLYAGADPYCAFIETFAHAAGTKIITTNALKERSLSELTATRPLRLIDLTKSGNLVRIGADALLFAGDYKVTQLWSKAFREAIPDADGLYYPSRLDPQKYTLALYEDRAPKITELKRESWYAPGAMRNLLAKIVDHYELELIENRFVSPRKPAARIRQEKLF